MRRFTVDEARQRFGSLIDELRLDTPFGEMDGSFVIEQDGQPVGLVMGYEGLLHIMDQQRDWMKAAIAEALADVEAGRVYEITTDEEHDAFFADLIREAEREVTDSGEATHGTTPDLLQRRRTA